MKKYLLILMLVFLSFSSTANAGAERYLALGLNAVSQNIAVVNYKQANLPLSTVSIPSGYVMAGVTAAPKPSIIGVALNFTTGGATGVTGPTQAQLDTAYASTPLSGKVTGNGGVQQWLVPTTGIYQIKILGAQGGINGNGNEGGKGADMVGNFNLTVGQKLDIIVGQKGLKSPVANPSNGGSGGGGGSFVWVDGQTVPLIVAGGGGGSGLINNGSPFYLGMDASVATYGTLARGDTGVQGKDGGDAPSGGHGWNTVKTSPNGTNGMNTYGGDGGFGGGGGAGWGTAPNTQHSAGGGGGYSGGAITNQNYYAGGGGGSYNSGTSQSNLVDATGDGKVIITQQ